MLGNTAEIDCTEQFDHVIWFGDLNFRLDASRDKVDNMLLALRDQQAPIYEVRGIKWIDLK